MEVSDADAQNEKLFVGFDGRDADLRSVTRYSMYDIMMYRTNLYTHSHRTAALVRAINSHALSLFKGYDTKKAELIALVHDDAEIIFGDIQAGNKSKMTPEQLREVHEQEARAIKKIAKRFPKQVGGYVYETLLEEAADYSSLEAQVVCYADKYDALGEAYHEALAGNHYFVTNVVNEYGKIPTPFEYYRDFFGGFLSRFPSLAPLFGVPPRCSFRFTPTGTDHSSLTGCRILQRALKNLPATITMMCGRELSWTTRTKKLSTICCA